MRRRKSARRGVYVHRIGRTGRAGRPTRRAVLFVTPRQQRMKRDVEHYKGQRIEPMRAPTEADFAARRAAHGFAQMGVAVGAGDDGLTRRASRGSPRRLPAPSVPPVVLRELL